MKSSHVVSISLLCFAACTDVPTSLPVTPPVVKADVARAVGVAAPPTITLQVEPNVVAPLQTFDLTALLTGTGALIAGTMQFFEGDCATGTALGGVNQAQEGFLLHSPPTYRAAGTYIFSVCFIPSTGDYAVGSASVTLTISKVPVTVLLYGLRQLPAKVGDQMSLEMDIVSAGLPTTASATGLASVYDGGTCLSPGPVLAADFPVSGGHTGFFFTVTRAATYDLLVCYSGDVNFLPGEERISLDVAPRATTTVIQTSGSQFFGDQLRLSAFVNDDRQRPVVAGTISFRIGTCAGPGVALNVSLGSGNATASVPYAVLGPVTYVACYGGTAAYLPSEHATTITVNPARMATRATATPAAQQYSDLITPSAVLTFDQGGSAGQPLGGTIEFSLDARVLGTVAFQASSYPYTVALAAPVAVTEPPGNHQLRARLVATGPEFTAGSEVTSSITIGVEDAALAIMAMPAEITPGTPLTLSVGVTERNPELNAGEAGAGQVAANTVPGVAVTMTGLGTGSAYAGVCGGGVWSGAGYASSATFSCTITPGSSFMSDIYVVRAAVSSSHYVGEIEDVVLVRDPSSGLASGAGRITIGTDPVVFGFSYSVAQGQKTPRGNLIAIRRLASGGACRVRSTQMNLPAVNWNATTSVGTATLGGKGTFACQDAKGKTTASQGNLDLILYAEDRGQPGAGADRFWISNGGGTTLGGVPNVLKMPAPGSANAKTLVNGNVNVPKPSP